MGATASWWEILSMSIYRFRQADPQIFNDKFKAYQEEEADGKIDPAQGEFPEPCRGFRSTNHVFERLMDEGNWRNSL